MIELRFHRDVYVGECVDRAVKVYAKLGEFELSEQDQHWVVKLSAKDPKKERRIAGELGNYALGLSAQNRGTP